MPDMISSYPTIQINILAKIVLAVMFSNTKNMKIFGREDEAMMCLHKLIYVSRLTKELCRFTSYSTSLYCVCQVERHREGALLLTKCNSEHNDDYYSISYALLWATF